MMLKALLTILCVIGVVIGDKAPVFLWGADSVSKPALQTVQKSEFADIVTPLLKDHMIVVFVEDNLLNSDFRCADSQTSKSCYAHLQGVNQKTYYASVENPIEVLHNVAVESESNTVFCTGELLMPLKYSPGKVVFIHFEKNDTDKREAVLKKHDAAISAISKDIKWPVVFVYTATKSSTPSLPSRRLRRSTANYTTGFHFRKDTQFSIFFTNATIGTYDETTKKTTEEIITVQDMTLTNYSDALFNVVLKTAVVGNELNFNVSYAAGYYSVGNILYKNITFRYPDLYAPTTFSYFCGNITLNGIGDGFTGVQSVSTLNLNSLQLQAPFNTTNNLTYAFSDPWHCVGFFTPGILSGLFVIIILLFVTFTGICWMVDINTMDRFDDPKGKTITISAE